MLHESGDEECTGDREEDQAEDRHQEATRSPHGTWTARGLVKSAPFENLGSVALMALLSFRDPCAIELQKSRRHLSESIGPSDGPSRTSDGRR